MQSTGQTSTQAVSFVPTQGSQMIYATSSPESSGSSTHTSPRVRALGYLQLQRHSITRRFFAAAAIAVACTAVNARQGAPPTGAVAAVAGFRRAPEFLTVFTPRTHRDAYTTWVSPLPLDELLGRLAPVPQLLHPPGSWQPTPTLPVDAFGDSGTYDKSRLTRLFGATRVAVARGPVASPGSPAETWTLMSPYPGPTLDHLERGTLLIVLSLGS